MPAVTKSGPWGLPDDTAPPDFFQAEWRALVGAALATGRLGTGWAITATGASTQITVGPGVAAIQGWLALETDGHVLDVATIPGAIAPAAGQTRIDYVVLTAGSFDLLAECVVEDDDALIELLNAKIRDLPGVLGTETFVYLRLVKQRYDWGTR